MEIVYVVIAVILTVMIIMTIVGPTNMPTFSLYSTGKESDCTCNGATDFIKKQWVRILDVLVLGPFALWLGYRLQKDGNYSIVPYLLYAYAFGTIVYNYSNMLAYANV